MCRSKSREHIITSSNSFTLAGTTPSMTGMLFEAMPASIFIFRISIFGRLSSVVSRLFSDMGASVPGNVRLLGILPKLTF
jgi:hypothetical protein